MTRPPCLVMVDNILPWFSWWIINSCGKIDGNEFMEKLMDGNSSKGLEDRPVRELYSMG